MIDVATLPDVTGATNRKAMPSKTFFRQILATVMAAASALSLQAATLYVSPQGNGSGGATWTTAYPTIQRAIDAAQGPTQIWIKEGAYFESLASTKPDVGLYGGFKGDETSLAARHGAATSVDANYQNRCLWLSGGHNWTLDRMTFRRGVYFGNGGGIYAANSNNLTVTKCIIEDCQPTGNSNGGGMYCSGCTLTMTDTLIQNCIAGDTGGGLRNLSTQAILTNVTFVNNRALRGGGLGSQGGNGNAGITSCTFKNNVATSTGIEGGGGALIQGAQFLISRCFFYGNQAGYGSALDIKAGTTSFFYNNIFSSNVAGTATVFIRDVDAYPRFLNNTYADNHSTIGQSVIKLSNYSQGYFRNENICFNTGPEAAIHRDVGCAYQWAWGNFYQNSVAPFTDPLDLAWAGSSTLQVDPKFVNRVFLHDPWSYQIQTGTPCIDYGFAQVPNDFGGAPRPINATNAPQAYPDRGAFEYQAVSQHASMTGWLGPGVPGDQSWIKLHCVIKNVQGVTVSDEFLPMSPDGFYRLRGAGVEQGAGPYWIYLSTKGFLTRRIYVGGLPAAGSPGMDVELLGGDATGDNVVNTFDLNSVLTQFATSTPEGDIDGDSLVTVLDLNSVLSNFGAVGDF